MPLKDGYYAAGFLSYESAPAFDSAYKVKEGTYDAVIMVWYFFRATALH